MTELPRLVVCAAIRSKLSGKIVCGARHYDPIMHAVIDALGGRKSLEWMRVEQGFIDQRGQFMSRQEAWNVAEAAEQIRRGDWDKGTLYSENLY